MVAFVCLKDETLPLIPLARLDDSALAAGIETDNFCIKPVHQSMPLHFSLSAVDGAGSGLAYDKLFKRLGEISRYTRKVIVNRQNLLLYLY